MATCKKPHRIGYHCYFLFCALSFIISLTSHAEVLSEVALFNRCYAQITGESPGPDHPIYASVQRGLKSAIHACLDVFSKADITETGYVSDTSDPEARAIQKNFYQFHRLWFEETSLTNAPEHRDYGEVRYLDPTEPALFLNRVLFKSNVNYKEVVTGDYGVRGLRSEGALILNPTMGQAKYIAENDVPAIHPMAGLERGDLIGVKKYAPEHNNKWWNDIGEQLMNLILLRSVSYAPKRSYGGGIAGLHSFIL